MYLFPFDPCTLLSIFVLKLLEERWICSRILGFFWFFSQEILVYPPPFIFVYAQLCSCPYAIYARMQIESLNRCLKYSNKMQGCIKQGHLVLWITRAITKIYTFKFTQKLTTNYKETKVFFCEKRGFREILLNRIRFFLIKKKNFFLYTYISRNTLNAFFGWIIAIC